jgi:hypothetical protein
MSSRGPGHWAHLGQGAKRDMTTLKGVFTPSIAIMPDCVMGPAIKDDLAARGLWPGIHLLGSGCVEADLLGTAAGYDKERGKS